MKRRRRAKPKPEPRQRPEPSFWKCTELPGNKLGIECPHCGSKTVVNRVRWVSIDRLYTSRGCTYCDWFATIPLEVLPARDPRRDVYES